MYRPLLVLAGLVWSAQASAATLSWERDAAADSCASNEAIEQQVEARLGKRLVDAQPEQRIQVRLERHGTTWSVRIAMQDAAGAVQGHRVLSVNSESCSGVEPYVALALALMIDPSAGFGNETDSNEPVGAEANTEAAESTASTETASPALAASSAAPSGVEPTAANPTTLEANSFGAGNLVVYVYPAARPHEPNSRPAALPVEPTTRRLQQLIRRRLVEREIYRVVETHPPPTQQIELARVARRATRLGSPKFVEHGRPVQAADYLLLPSIEQLTVQDSFDYSTGKSTKLLGVRLKVQLLVVNARERRELPPFSANTAVSLEGDSSDPKAARFAVELAAARATDELFEALRSEPAFRMRPRFLEDPAAGPTAELRSLQGAGEGDRFEFEDEAGRRSGYASVYGVGATRARLQVWKSGNGRLLALGKPQTVVSSISLWNAHRIAYQKASASELQRAADGGVAVRHFGAGTEIGLMWRLMREAAGTRFRPFADVGWTFMAVNSLALNVEARGGVGYQLTLIPALGLGFLPYASAGGMLVRGRLAVAGGGDTGLGGLIGATATVGGTFEFYRIFGDVSLAATTEATYVLPLYSMSSRDDFVDRSYPALHALSFQLGAVYRPSEFSN